MNSIVVFCSMIFGATASEVTGFRRLFLNAGPNVATALFAWNPHIRTAVEGVTPNIVALAQPGAWSKNQVAPRDGFAQSILLVSRDSSESPGCEGDGWLLLAHTRGTVPFNTLGGNFPSAPAFSDTRRFASNRQ